MFFDRIVAKQEAKQIIRGASPSPLLVSLLYLLLTSGVSTLVQYFAVNPFGEVFSYLMQGYDIYDVVAYVFGGGRALVAIFVNILLSLYTTVLAFGYNGYTLDLARGKQSGFARLFDGFALVVKVILLQILTFLIVCAGYMLFILPGVIAAFSLCMGTFCMLDDPGISPVEALRRSRAMMRGQKLNYFLIQLSFFGWIILGTVLSSGLSWLIDPAAGDLAALAFNVFLMPYQNIVISRFYSDLARFGQAGPGPRVEF